MKTNEDDLSCAVCFDVYSNDKCISANDQLLSSVCQHSLCLQCSITHVIAYRRDFCPLCRREGAFLDEAIQAHITHEGDDDDDGIPTSIEPLIAAAVDTRVRETLVYPCIEQMTEMLAGDSSTLPSDGTLPSLQLSPRHLLSMCAILRREDSFLATFSLTSQDTGMTVYYRAEHAPAVPRLEDTEAAAVEQT